MDPQYTNPSQKASISWGRLKRGHDFNPHIVAKKLAAHCSFLRPDSPCTLAVRADSGTEHVIKVIDFEDGVKWVARLPCPAYEQPGRFASCWETRVTSEVATHGLILQETDIPVPEVYYFDATNGTIGWPFVLMRFMPGISASRKLASATPEQDSNFLRQMAQIHMKLANVRMKKIGSVYQSSTGFEVGLDVETAQGPFDKPQQYYQAVASHRYERFTNETSVRIDGQDLLTTFSLCLKFVPDEYTEDDFGLANRDLGPHNLLVDEHFNVVALIDVDCVVSAPVHVVANLPHRTWSELDLGSSDLGVRKRVKEYINAQKADGPDFSKIRESPLAMLWAELERLDHCFGVDESVRFEQVRSITRFVMLGESFLEGGRGEPTGV